MQYVEYTVMTCMMTILRTDQIVREQWRQTSTANLRRRDWLDEKVGIDVVYQRVVVVLIHQQLVFFIISFLVIIVVIIVFFFIFFDCYLLSLRNIKR